MIRMLLECVGSCPGRRCHRRSHEQDRGPRADRKREQVREDERGQANAGECRRCSCSMTSSPGVDAPEAADQQHDAPQGARAGADGDRIAGDQRAGGDRRCGRGAHWEQRSARSAATPPGAGAHGMNGYNAAKSVLADLRSA